MALNGKTTSQAGLMRYHTLKFTKDPASGSSIDGWIYMGEDEQDKL
jgi:hypothetical protein